MRKDVLVSLFWLYSSLDGKINMIKVFLYTFTTAFFISLASCSSSPSPEEQIEEFISEVVKESESRDLRGLKKLISENYSDKNKRTRKEILQIAASHFIRNKNINILNRFESLIFSDDETTASLTVYAAISNFAIQEDDMKLLQADIHRFDIDLQKVSKRWLLSSAKWQRASIDDFLKR